MPEAIGGAIAGPLIGSAVGGLTSGKKQTSTATNKPYLPDNYQKGFDDLLSGAQTATSKPFTPAPTSRVAPPTNAFSALFANPELLQIQRGADKSYFDKLMNPAPATPAPTNAISPATADTLKARQLIQQAAGPGGVYSNRGNQPYQAILQHGTDADYSDIAKVLGPNATLAPNGQFYDATTGRPIDTSGLGAIFRKYA